MPDTPLDLELRYKKRVSMIVGALAVVLSLGVYFSDHYVPAVENWTTTQVVRHSPDKLLRMAMMADEERAFYTCAKSVVRRLGDSSIATFNARTAASTWSLGEGRYLVRSQFSESNVEGTTQQSVFTCTVRLEGDRWVIEELQTWVVGNPPANLPVGPTATTSGREPSEVSVPPAQVLE
jgi:hypothetical protein